MKLVPQTVGLAHRLSRRTDYDDYLQLWGGVYSDYQGILIDLSAVEVKCS